jgi:hypothetical protein
VVQFSTLFEEDVVMHEFKSLELISARKLLEWRQGFFKSPKTNRLCRQRGTFSKLLSLMALFPVIVIAFTHSARGVEVPGVGWEGQGADILITNIDTDPRPDMLLMAYDNPAQANNFRYKIGFNLDANGIAANWSNLPQVDGVGWEGQGAGAAITNLDGDARPELIFMAYDNPARANNFRYKIGWNLDNIGAAQRWDTGFTMIDGVGWEGQGADILITNLDDNPRPEMVLMAYDNPAQANNFRYKIGWNLGSNGVAQRWDAGFTMVAGVGWEGQGAGSTIANLDNDPRPELILMAYDNPAQANGFRYKVGWNLGTNGIAQNWDTGLTTVDGVGWEGQGAGIAMGNLDDDPRSDMLLMAYDNPAQANSFRYVVRRNIGPAQEIWLEIDKLANVNWPPNTANRNGRDYSLAQIYRPLGIAINMQQNQASIADPLPGACFGDADLDGFRAANMNSPPPAGSPAWHMYAEFVTCYTTPGILGIMFDSGPRRSYAVFMSQFGGDQQRIMRTFAHELGHALCLYHTDGDASRPSGPVAGAGRTVMNQTSVLAADWGYAWSAGEMHKVWDRSKQRWRPNSGFAFGNCH